MAIINTEKLNSAATGFGTLPLTKQLGVFAGLAASIALGIMVVNWAKTPNYQPIYGHLDSQDISKVIDALQQAGIQYKMEKGLVLVESNKLHQARLLLANEDIGHGRGNGYELLDKDQSLGTSRFMESTRYKRSLEGELARTIGHIKGIKHARVHLALPKQSNFLRDQRTPTASVMLNLYAGRHLKPEQIAAIENLVASSIPSMNTDNVTVVDQNGRLLSEGQPSAMSVANRHFNYIRQLEGAYVKYIEDILTPLIGDGKVRAKVSADVDFTHNEQTRESYSPDSAALRSEQSLVENMSSSGGASGVPGTLAGQVPEEGKGSGGSANDTRQQATKNYELDRTISHTKNQVGRIKRLTVAVVLDHKDKIGAKGKVTKTPLSKEELEKYTELVRNAVGFNPQRGDRVNVINSPFAQKPAAEEMPEPGMTDQPWFWNTVKQVLGGAFILLLIFGVLKPILRNLSSKNEAEKALAAMEDNMTNNPGNAADSGQEQMKLLASQDGQQEQMRTAQNLADADPKRVAQVVKDWLNDQEK